MGKRKLGEGGKLPPKAQASTLRVNVGSFRPHDITTEHTTPFHDPEEQIWGRLGIRASLAEMNGPNYSGSPRCWKNVRTAELLGQKHHCGDRKSGHAETKQCHEDGHMFYCPGFRDFTVAGVVYRVRCGIRCTVESDGCSIHKRMLPGSMARLICDMWSDKVQVTTWRRFNDPRLNELWDKQRDSNPGMSSEELRKLVQQDDDVLEQLAAGGNAKKEDFEKKGDWHRINAAKMTEEERRKKDAAERKSLNDQTVGDLKRGGNGTNLSQIQGPHSKAYNDNYVRNMTARSQAMPNIPTNARLAELDRKNATLGQSVRPGHGRGGRSRWNEENQENEERKNPKKEKKAVKKGQLPA